MDCVFQEQIIVGTIPADFDYDGDLDLLVVLTDQNAKANGFQFFFMLQNDDNTFSTSSVSTPYTSLTYPWVADFNGDHSTSVMYFDSTAQQYQVIEYPQDPAQQPIVRNFTTYVSSGTGCLSWENGIPSDNPTNFNSVIDINGDCRADLVTLSYNSQTKQQQIEFWETQDDQETVNGRYCLRTVMPINGFEVLSMNFADVNFDGLVDMITVVEQSSQQLILVSYNQNPIQSVKNLCYAGTSFQDIPHAFPFETLSFANSTAQISTSLPSGYQLYQYNNPQLQNLYSPFLRFGDFESTGYPGALVTLLNTQNNQPYTVYVVNRGCDDEECTNLADNIKDQRILYATLTPDTTGLKQISQYPSLVGAFFDYGENGRLDFLLNTVPVVNNEINVAQANITAFYNYLSLDAFYLKAMGLNGQCTPNSDSKLECLGALYYGSTYMFSVSNIGGTYQPGFGAQLYQSAMSPLQLPYGYMGLSRTNNYVEDFYIGIPLQVNHIIKLNKDGAIKKWTPIIPNSQLIISPNTQDTSNWTISIFIEPTDAILVVVIVTIIVLVILGAVVVWKHIKEKEEDKKSQENFFQMFR